MKEKAEQKNAHVISIPDEKHSRESCLHFDQISLKVHGYILTRSSKIIVQIKRFDLC